MSTFTRMLYHQLNKPFLKVKSTVTHYSRVDLYKKNVEIIHYRT